MDNQDEFKGLGGWLILVGIGIVIRPILLLATTVPLYLQVFTDGIWEAITREGSEAYNPLLSSLLIGEIIYNIVFFSLSLYLIYLFFAKHYFFPRFYIAIVVVSLIIIPLDAWLVSLALPNQPMFDSETITEFAQTLISGLIWVPYMLFSKRVKAIFVAKKPIK